MKGVWRGEGERAVALSLFGVPTVIIISSFMEPLVMVARRLGAERLPSRSEGGAGVEVAAPKAIFLQAATEDESDMDQEMSRQVDFERSAYHEAGHAVVACLLNTGTALGRVSIQPLPVSATLKQIANTRKGMVEGIKRRFNPITEQLIHTFPERFGRNQLDALRRSDILVHLAGPLAEAMFDDRLGHGDYHYGIEVWIGDGECDPDQKDYHDAMELVEQTEESISIYLADAERLLSTERIWNAVHDVAQALLGRKPDDEGRHVIELDDVEELIEKHVPEFMDGSFALHPLDRSRLFAP